MTAETEQSTVVRTERGFTIAGTHLTLYDILDYLHAGWPPKLIRERLNLTNDWLELLDLRFVTLPEVDHQWIVVTASCGGLYSRSRC